MLQAAVACLRSYSALSMSWCYEAMSSWLSRALSATVIFSRELPMLSRRAFVDSLRSDGSKESISATVDYM